MEGQHPTDPQHGFISRLHHRLVTKGAGFRLSTFKGTRELLSATFDVFTGMVFIHQDNPSLNTPHSTF